MIRVIFALALFLIPAIASADWVYPITGGTVTGCLARCQWGSSNWSVVTPSESAICLSSTVSVAADGLCSYSVHVTTPQGEFDSLRGPVSPVNSICPAAGTSYSAGYYGLGTLPSTIYPALTPCTSTGCTVQFACNGCTENAISRLINGVKNYYVKGSYAHTGETCTPGTVSDVPPSASALPGSTCAPGQSYISMSGREKCFDSGTGTETSTASASAVESAATKALQDALARAASAASAVQAAKDAAAAAGGDASAVQQAGVAAAARVASDQAQQDQTDACKDSNSISCMETGDVPEADAIGEREVDFSTFTFNTYTFNGSASCPAPRVVTIHGQQSSFSYQPFCDFLSVFKFAALAVSMFIAAMIMIGQRSSDSQG